MKHILPHLIALTICHGTVNGAITIDATTTFVTPVTTFANSQTFDASGFNPSGSDKLVAAIIGRGGSFLTAPTVTFNGQEMNHIVTRDTPAASTHRGVSSLFYIDAPGTGGNLMLTYNTQIQDLGIVLFALSGTATGFTGSTIQSNNSLSGTIATSVDGSLVIAGGWYGDDFTAPVEVSLSVDSPLTSVLSTQIDATNPSSAAAAGYYLDPDAGNVSISFTGSSGTPVSNFVAAAFAPAPIPEPSVMLLGGLGLLALLRRRRC